ncbi:MAG: TlpA family protein disulfide reductase [Nitrospinae bacterium]|nr:TlpA family protein disulfide reductase [Nitrospinota bacterium]
MSETNGIRKERSITTFIPFILLITVMLLIVFVFHVKKEGGDYVNKKINHRVSPTISHIAPDFTLPDIKENNVTLSELRGKVVFLNFWATWCVVCREDLPSMERLYQRFKDDDFEMLTINIDKSGRSGVESYMKELGLTFPVLIDSGGKVSRMYQITGVPETFIIGKNGEIVYKAIGPVEWTKEAWLNAFSNLINK